MNESLTTKMNIGEVRFSYCHLFTPEAVSDGADKKYSVSVIIPKTNTQLITGIKDCINAAFQQGLVSRWKGRKPATWKNPLRDGDLERPDDDSYANAYFINVTSRTKPGIVKRVTMGGKTTLMEITNEEEIYSGCYGYVSVNFFPFSNAGNNGVACGLNNVLKTKDGEFLGGRSSAQTDFGGLIDSLPEDNPEENWDDLPL